MRTLSTEALRSRALERLAKQRQIIAVREQVFRLAPNLDQEIVDHLMNAYAHELVDLAQVLTTAEEAKPLVVKAESWPEYREVHLTRVEANGNLAVDSVSGNLRYSGEQWRAQFTGRYDEQPALHSLEQGMFAAEVVGRDTPSFGLLVLSRNDQTRSVVASYTPDDKEPRTMHLNRLSVDYGHTSGNFAPAPSGLFPPTRRATALDTLDVEVGPRLAISYSYNGRPTVENLVSGRWHRIGSLFICPYPQVGYKGLSLEVREAIGLEAPVESLGTVRTKAAVIAQLPMGLDEMVVDPREPDVPLLDTIAAALRGLAPMGTRD